MRRVGESYLTWLWLGLGLDARSEYFSSSSLRIRTKKDIQAKLSYHSNTVTKINEDEGCVGIILICGIYITI